MMGIVLGLVRSCLLLGVLALVPTATPAHAVATVDPDPSPTPTPKHERVEARPGVWMLGGGFGLMIVGSSVLIVRRRRADAA